MLLDLPGECLVEVARCLPARDLLRLQSVSKALRDIARQREVWEPRLAAEFGVRLTVCTRRLSLCRDLPSPHPASRPLPGHASWHC